MLDLVSAARAGLLVLAIPMSLAQAQCDLAWAASDPSPYLLGTVRDSIAWDPDGAGPLATRLVVGGLGLTGGNFANANLAMFDGTEWTPLPTAGQVRRLCVVQGQLVVATIDPQPTGTTSKLSVQTPGGYSVVCDNVAGTITSIVDHLGEIVFAGDFRSIGAQVHNRIAKLSSTGQLTALGSGISGVAPIANATVWSLASFNGRLIAGGDFAMAGGVAATNLAVWNGSAWGPLGNPNGIVFGLGVRVASTLNNTYLFAAGQFTAFGPIPATSVARFSDATNSWAAMSMPDSQSVVDLDVRGVGLTGYELFASGAFGVRRWSAGAWTTIPGGGPTAGLCFWNGQLHGAPVNNLGPGVSDPNRHRISRLEVDTWVPVAGRGIAGVVHAALPDGSDYVIGGSFRSISGAVVNGVARGRPGAWQPMGTGLEGGSVLALVRLPGGEIVAGGDFTTAGGQPAQGLARWNGSAWAPFGGGGTVRALAVLGNGDLLVGGTFSTMGGTPANQVARWNGTSWSALGAGVTVPVSATVRCFRQLANGDVLVGGTFSTAGAVAAANVARWDGQSWFALGAGLAASVRGLDQLATGEILAWGGHATSVAQVWNGLFWSPVAPATAASVGATLLPNGGVAFATGYYYVSNTVVTPFEGTVSVRSTPPNGTNSGYSTWPLRAAEIGGVLVAPNGDVAIHGDLWARGPLGGGAAAIDTGCSGFVILQPTCRAQVASQPSGCTGAPAPTFAAQALPWLGGTYRARASGLQPNALAFEVLGLQAANVPLGAVVPQGVPGCTLLTTTEAVQLRLPLAGVVDVQLALPSTASLVGVLLRHQLVEVGLGAGGALGAVRASNLLLATLGSY